MSNIQYKEFNSREQFKKYCFLKKSYSIDVKEIETIYVWRKIETIYVWRKIENNEVWVLSSNIGETENITEYCPIRCVSVGSEIAYYFQKDDIEIHTLFVYWKLYEYQSFETKLYHLTHGPKTLSIPDAFKVLSL